MGKTATSVARIDHFLSAVAWRLAPLSVDLLI